MPELVKDETQVEIVDEKVRITRTISEDYPAEEFGRTMVRFDMQLEDFETKKKEIVEMKAKLGTKEALAFVKKAEEEMIKKRKEEMVNVEKEIKDSKKAD